MFSKIIARKKAIQEASAAAKDEWLVKDRFTHKELFRGPRDKCEAVQNAFGQCYLEVA